MIVRSPKYEFDVSLESVINLVRRVDSGHPIHLPGGVETTDVGLFHEAWFDYYIEDGLTESDAMELTHITSVKRIN